MKTYITAMLLGDKQYIEQYDLLFARKLKDDDVLLKIFNDPLLTPEQKTELMCSRSIILGLEVEAFMNMCEDL